MHAETAKTVDKGSGSQVKEYSARGHYTVGDKIYHPVFEDTGKVVKKLPAPGNLKRIIVKFSRVGEKKLIATSLKPVVREGSKVKVAYKLTTEDGSVAERTRRGKPAQVTVGKKDLFPKLEEALVGMQEGEYKTVELEPEEAYGEYRQDLLYNLDRSELGEKKLKTGRHYRIRNREGNIIRARLVELGPEKALFDANSYLAGRRILAHVELKSIADEG